MINLYVEDYKNIGEYIKIEISETTMVLEQSRTEIEDITKQKADFIRRFKIPASAHNLSSLGYINNIYIYHSSSQVVKIPAWLQRNTEDIKGELVVKGIKYSNNLPVEIDVEFYSETVAVIKRLGDFKLSDLDIELPSQKKSRYLQVNTKGDFMVPLISKGRNWVYGGGGLDDVGVNEIKENELCWSISVLKVVEEIENKFNLEFNRQYLNDNCFTDLYILLNNENKTSTQKHVELTQNTPGLSSYQTVNYIVSGWGYGGLKMDNLILTFDNLSGHLKWRTRVRLKGLGIEYKIRVIHLISIEEAYVVKEFSANSDDTWTANIEIPPNSQNKYDGVYWITIEGEADDMLTYMDVAHVFGASTTGSRRAVNVPFYLKDVFSDIVPDIKISDFITGLSKQFRLIIDYPKWDTANNYYDEGELLDITDIVDINSFDKKVFDAPKSLIFKYKKTEAFMGKAFRKFNDPVNDENGYGDLFETFPALVGSESKVELPFSLMLFERPSNQITGNLLNVHWGKSINVDEEGKAEPNRECFLFYATDHILDMKANPFKLEGQPGLRSVRLIGNFRLTNTVIAPENTLDYLPFSPEVDSYFLEVLPNFLFDKYYKVDIQDRYLKGQMTIDYDIITNEYINNKLKLNSKIIVNDSVYKINSIKTDLISRRGKIELFYNSGLFI